MADGYRLKGSPIDGFTLRPLRTSAEDETALSKFFDELDESTAGELYARSMHGVKLVSESTRCNSKNALSACMQLASIYVCLSELMAGWPWL